MPIKSRNLGPSTMSTSLVHRLLHKKWGGDKEVGQHGVTMRGVEGSFEEVPLVTVKQNVPNPKGGRIRMWESIL